MESCVLVYDNYYLFDNFEMKIIKVVISGSAQCQERVGVHMAISNLKITSLNCREIVTISPQILALVACGSLILKYIRNWCSTFQFH